MKEEGSRGRLKGRKKGIDLCCSTSDAVATSRIPLVTDLRITNQCSEVTKTGLCAKGRSLTSGSHAGGATQWRHRPAEVHTVSPALTASTHIDKPAK